MYDISDINNFNLKKINKNKNKNKNKTETRYIIQK